VKEIWGISASNGISNAVDCAGAAKVIEQMIQGWGIAR